MEDSYIICTPDRTSKKPEPLTPKRGNGGTDLSTHNHKQDTQIDDKAPPTPHSATSKQERKLTNRINKRTPTRCSSRSPERLGAFGMHARRLRKGLASPLKPKAWAEEVSEKGEYQAEDFEAWRDCELDW